MVVARRYIYTRKFHGFPTDDNIQMIEEELPDLKDGEVLLEADYLSVDPYVRSLIDRLKVPVGSTIIGRQIGKVVETKHEDYKIGERYWLETGWRTHSLIKPENTSIRPVKDYGGLPVSLALGTLGAPGATAYLGLMQLLKPKAGDVVFVNAAAGAVGHVVGQIAKILGCKVIGCAGSTEKINWLKDLGFDVAFNYKTDDLSKVLLEAAPNGINCFFDNVGGELFNNVIINHMAECGRVAICGGISTYNNTAPVKGELPYQSILLKTLSVQGFIVGKTFTVSQWLDAFDKMAEWIKEGKLQYREHITNGFENMRKAFYELFSGENIGKAIVKV